MGDHAAVHGGIHFGLSAEELQKTAEELGVAKAALRSFFKILEKQNVPPEDLDCTLRQIANQYKELQKKLASSVIIDNPEIAALKEQAGEALDTGNFDQAEALLNEAGNKGLECIKQLKVAENQSRLSTAQSKAELGVLKTPQLEYNTAAEYYR